jgi:uncharacterized protein
MRRRRSLAAIDPMATQEETGLRRLTREQARRIAVRAQMLDADRPRNLVSLAERLTMLQVDPTAVVSPSADLIAWTRLGHAYRPAHLQQAVEQDRTLFEVRAQPTPIEPPIAMVRPMADVGFCLAEMATWVAPGTRRRKWLEANDAFRRRVLDQLRDSGPLASRDIPDTSSVSWQSTGWTNDRNVIQMLEFLALGGEVAVSARRGRQRLWDLAERIFPAGLTIIPAEEARRIRAEHWLRSLGVARPRVVGEAGLPAEIEGTKGIWRLDPDTTAEAFKGRTALLSPFDRLSHDRARSTCSTLITCSRCTSRSPNDAGATSRCRCSTTIGSSARSTWRPIVTRPSCRSTRYTRTCRSRVS